ncbi:uncharacterized protein LOC120427735 [Culex pipiens pallens]|uniref:uncharacterized protein LOC120427735 n=1 Tax=Culex pipiens pallens TaxID=42434 RepID=UPI001953E745|nr:uncharacterized protein LOC120427735 [Culex pipiens pallens]
MRRLPRDLLWTAVSVLCRFQVLFGLVGVSGMLEPASGRRQEGPPSHSRATEPRDQPAQRNGKRGALHSHDHRTGALIHQRRKPGCRFRPGRWSKSTTSLLTKKQIECDVNCEENKI